MQTPANRTVSGHTYVYWLTDEKWNNSSDIPFKIIFNKKEKSNAVDINNDSYSLSSLDIFPNPFNSTTNLKFQLKKETELCQMKIYDIKGNRVFSKKFFVNNNNSTIIWSPHQDLSSGEYLVILKTDHEILRQKVIYLK